MKTITRGCALILYDSNLNILLQHRCENAGLNPNVHALWGGEIEEHETPYRAMIREAKEELGIDIHPRYLSHYGTVQHILYKAKTPIELSKLVKDKPNEGKGATIITPTNFETVKYAPGLRQIIHHFYQTNI